MTTRRTPATSTSPTDIVLGLLLTLAGLVLLGGTYLKVIPSSGAFAAFLLGAGLLGIVGALVGRTSPGFFTEITSSALITVLALVMLRFPETPLATLVLLAGAFCGVNGIVRLASATEFPSLRGVLLIGGAASVALALAVFADAVKPALPNLGIVLGVALVIDGISALVIGRHLHPSRH